ncbi:MAG: gluconate 2-dehydrogenase subunit 3 family protein [Alphaproteobacteria bacterium]|nr:gluconate 2-dehydrogenase subunit 3 family protein [Alphaproteobacteria bacterium]MBU1516905.1 gluconate 2-dehydrogenase subunit 3 family protein [Alphaproteobacteria bacterium]MBU2092600.1 gluconate 2-dehydrogenase subunit 3 family protein [Alphaproteobacteria bacterium]MBU2151289.1 gluconate 2-dehydrogenase subunit 3 family protein [Alphaproteobacteria bacterium]MBU2309591.1 gluconate 2-dehydrogenase subunit 3 family protein [Alphaproteobacteria bacterium]
MSDAPQPYVRKIDRRTALTWIGVVGAATAVGAGVVVYGPKMGGQPEAKGYGTDPKLVTPDKAPWPRLLSDEELQAAAILADFILPASGAAPAASALGIPDFIDEWVSAPYPDQLKDRPTIRDGLKALAKKSVAERPAAMTALQTSGDAFFKRFRALTIGAYYTTEEGFKDIGFIGNVAREADEGPSPEVKTALEAALKTLGL